MPWLPTFISWVEANKRPLCKKGGLAAKCIRSQGLPPDLFANIPGAVYFWLFDLCQSGLAVA